MLSYSRFIPTQKMRLVLLSLFWLSGVVSRDHSGSELTRGEKAEPGQNQKAIGERVFPEPMKATGNALGGEVSPPGSYRIVVWDSLAKASLADLQRNAFLNAHCDRESLFHNGRLKRSALAKEQTELAQCFRNYNSLVTAENGSFRMEVAEAKRSFWDLFGVPTVFHVHIVPLDNQKRPLRSAGEPSEVEQGVLEVQGRLDSACRAGADHLRDPQTAGDLCVLDYFSVEGGEPEKVLVRWLTGKEWPRMADVFFLEAFLRKMLGEVAQVYRGDYTKGKALDPQTGRLFARFGALLRKHHSTKVLASRMQMSRMLYDSLDGFWTIDFEELLSQSDSPAAKEFLEWKSIVSEATAQMADREGSIVKATFGRWMDGQQWAGDARQIGQQTRRLRANAEEHKLGEKDKNLLSEIGLIVELHLKSAGVGRVAARLQASVEIEDFFRHFCSEGCRLLIESLKSKKSWRGLCRVRIRFFLDELARLAEQARDCNARGTEFSDADKQLMEREIGPIVEEALGQSDGQRLLAKLLSVDAVDAALVNFCSRRERFLPGVPRSPTWKRICAQISPQAPTLNWDTVVETPFLEKLRGHRFHVAQEAFYAWLNGHGDTQLLEAHLRRLLAVLERSHSAADMLRLQTAGGKGAQGLGLKRDEQDSRLVAALGKGLSRLLSAKNGEQLLWERLNGAPGLQTALGRMCMLKRQKFRGEEMFAPWNEVCLVRGLSMH